MNVRWLRWPRVGHAVSHWLCIVHRHVEYRCYTERIAFSRLIAKLNAIPLYFLRTRQITPPLTLDAKLLQIQ
jgi:hypothetical protein